MREKLKALNLDRILDIDEAVEMSAYARTLEMEYGTLDLPTPEWLVKSSDLLREEIARRTRANDLAMLKAVEAEIESYKTAAEKRTEAQKRLANIQKKLGMTPKTVAAK